ncbi:hypothetical protein [Spongiactinospora sp. TRM90649]|uniref:hypothetical protein n=1 Tax=Spongiactinospora sp. TRM90649 TaxID=3031114 RepID=UPI0023F99A53|nr:hypothetical protein [Spongiactinospora sp. TRM90649]MDF5751761.1 hypothetical protein [Spongiactinospora sp. TRM90649]
MLRQGDQVRRHVIDEGLAQGTDPRDGLRRFLHTTVAELDTNPLYRRVMSHPEEMEAVSARLTPERLAAAESGATADLLHFLTTHLPGDPHILLGTLRADRLGPDLYPRS